MPAKKSARVQMRRRLINRRARSSSRTAVKGALRTLTSGDPEKAGTAVTQAIGSLDRAASKGVIHRNAAARSKSRLMKRLHAATGAAK